MSDHTFELPARALNFTKQDRVALLKAMNAQKARPVILDFRNTKVLLATYTHVLLSLLGTRAYETINMGSAQEIVFSACERERIMWQTREQEKARTAKPVARERPAPEPQPEPVAPVEPTDPLRDLLSRTARMCRVHKLIVTVNGKGAPRVVCQDTGRAFRVKMSLERCSVDDDHSGRFKAG